MSQTRKTWRRLLLAWAIFTCLAAVMAGCMSLPYARGTVSQLLPEDPPSSIDSSYAVDGRRIHYVERPGGPARILFIHGAPGDWQGWAPYLRDRGLHARATMIAVDRPGWGQSGFGAVVPDLDAQAALLRPLLDDDAGGPTLLVAHSYGGAVAARLAMNDPDKVAGLVLIAPTLSAALEGPRWYDRLATLFPIRFLLPEKLKLAYAELAPLPEQLRAMQPRWAGLRLPISVVQGEDDTQVDPRTADFAQHELPGGEFPGGDLPSGSLSITRVAGQGHWILWTRPELITATILATLQRASNYAPRALPPTAFSLSLRERGRAIWELEGRRFLITFFRF